MRRQALSWCVFSALAVMGVLEFYGAGWRQDWSIPASAAWSLRLIVIAVILAVSAAAAALAHLLPVAVRPIKAAVAGLLTGMPLHYLAGWVGDHYLGGNAHVDPHNLGRLMTEGYGMTMYILITPLIGVLAWIRAEIAWWWWGS